MTTSVVWRRKWIITLAVIVTTGTAYLLSARQPDRTASADLIYETNLDVANPLSASGNSNRNERQLEVAAMTNILQSPEVVEKAEIVVRASTMNPSCRTRERPWSLAKEPGQLISPATPSAPPCRKAESNSSVGSNIVTVSAQSTDPALAAAAANGYAQTFVGHRMAQQREQIAKAIRVVMDQVDQIPPSYQQSADYVTLQQRLRDLQILAGLPMATTACWCRRRSRAHRSSRGPCVARSSAWASASSPVSASPTCSSSSTPVFATRTRSRASCGSRSLARAHASRASWPRKNALVALHRPGSQAAEAFRMIRTNLEFMSVDDQVRSILITSCVQGEGKSVSVANLACIMAMAGKKVVVVDADLRRPVSTSTSTWTTRSVSAPSRPPRPRWRRRSSRSTSPRGPGSAGDGDFAEWAHGADTKSKLFVLPSGPLPPNPGEIVSSRRFGLMIQALEKEADLVIVDSPAMLAVGDTAALSPPRSTAWSSSWIRTR